MLSSYEPTTWTIELTEGAELGKIVTIGSHDQLVVAPESIEVESQGYLQGGCFDCGYALPGDGGGCEGEDLVGLAESLTERELTAFDGCYVATDFTY